MAHAQVIDLTRFMGKGKPQSRPFGTVRCRPGSTKISVRFTYFGRVVEFSTGLDNTKENLGTARAFLDEVGQGIRDGTFRFAEVFPGASEEFKADVAQLEGWEYSFDPRNVRFGEYLATWLVRFQSGEPSANKRRDYSRHVGAYLRPYFGDMPFSGINGVTVKEFVLQLRSRSGNPLAGSTLRNVLTVFRAIWDDACEEYGWDLADPLEYVKRKNRKNQIIPKKKGSSPETFRPDEYLTLLAAMEPYYRPATEMMVLTGMIASELAGFRRGDDEGNRLVIQNSIVRGLEKTALKTDYRRREVPVTAAIRRVVDEVKARTQGDYLFTMVSGIPFEEGNFRKNPWTRALQRAGLPYRKPYALRHTFAAWSLIVGVHPERLVRLMGHGSKQMVYEVYGKYIEGLDVDRERIRDYVGEDFR